MKITGPNQYEVVDGEVIRVTVEAVGIPYNASYGPHTNGALWTITQHATAQIPKQIQEFTVPKSDGRFEITYGFGPAPADGAHYLRTVESGGVVDGPFRVRVIEGFSNLSVPYFFDTVQPAKKNAKKKKPAGKKKNG